MSEIKHSQKHALFQAQQNPGIYRPGLRKTNHLRHDHLYLYPHADEWTDPLERFGHLNIKPAFFTNQAGFFHILSFVQIFIQKQSQKHWTKILYIPSYFAGLFKVFSYIFPVFIILFHNAFLVYM